jgi:hypothetical protein
MIETDNIKRLLDYMEITNKEEFLSRESLIEILFEKGMIRLQLGWE